jgi:nitrite reductase/ring-hydroxylating ferredoxin subunit
VKHEVCDEDDLEPGQMRSVMVGTLAVTLIRKADGSFSALRDRCPHRGAPLSKGLLQRQVHGDAVGIHELRSNVIVRCPWHGYEFDVDTGLCPAEPDRVRVKAYSVTVENGKVMLER